MEFTPGPWEAVRMATNHEVQAANGVQVIADVYSAGIGTHEANAHLIAAAPEMYEALKVAKEALRVLLYEHPNDDIGNTQMKVIDKALAKAEGK